MRSVSKITFQFLLDLVHFKMNTQYKFLFIIIIVVFIVTSKGTENEEGSVTSSKGNSERSKQKVAMEQWASNLVPERDYTEAQWRISFHSRSPSTYFDQFANRLSKVFKAVGATVNFAMIGACDGTNDPTIRDRYLPNSHWKGVFVEPMSVNYNDLVKHLEEKGAAQRSHPIRGAATSKCTSPTIVVERPLYEEKNASLPHWLRRQIGSIVPEQRIAKASAQGKELKARNKEWILETVRCLTASDILIDWGNATTSVAARDKAKGKGRGPRRRRPHILKVRIVTL